MFTLYRRHRQSCEHKADRFYRRCRCSMWIEGTGPAGYIRRSLKVSSWEKAEALRRELEDPKDPQSPELRAITVAEAAQKFLGESIARNLAPASLKKYRAFCDLLRRFAERHCPLLTSFTPELVREFRDSWKVGPYTTAKRLELVRSFFRFCEENDWIGRSPARGLKAPVLRQNPTLPFTADEMERILECSGDLLTFVLLLRHTALRISDAARLRTSQFDGERIFLYMQKTGVPVSLPVPPQLSRLLKETTPRGGYFFLRGQSTALDNWTDLWRRQLAKVFDKAGIVNGHPHRFRDTFAVDLLENGVSLEEVSVLLGHASI
ncbi:MAG: site-specific integrase, partial [Bryobacteraceae bacterium]|nr:site-specific integrase [Bryobacteraceae bacterium]